MRRDELIELLMDAFEQAADQLRTEGQEDPWPEELQARDIVRLLRERSRDLIASE